MSLVPLIPYRSATRGCGTPGFPSATVLKPHANRIGRDNQVESKVGGEGGFNLKGKAKSITEV